jgi:hypothetical protein
MIISTIYYEISKIFPQAGSSAIDARFIDEKISDTLLIRDYLVFVGRKTFAIPAIFPSVTQRQRST